MTRTTFSAIIALILLIAIITGCGKKSEQELFTIAEQAQSQGNPIEAIKTYRTLLNEYPGGVHRPKAFFMIGFVYSEQLNDTAKAVEAFDNFLREFPDHELANSANFMVKSLRGEVTDPVLTE